MKQSVIYIELSVMEQKPNLIHRMTATQHDFVVIGGAKLFISENTEHVIRY